MGVDEKAYRKGHRYLTLVNDLNQGRVLYIAVGRDKASLDGFWPTLKVRQMAAIRGVAMDMWEAYEQSVREHVPQAQDKIVFDKFHVAKHLGEGVDKVRRNENRELRKSGDERLVGTRYQ